MTGGTATFSPCGRYRYWLTREFKQPELGGVGTVVFVMLNPSTADAERVDPTVRRCIRYAERWGAARLIVVNIFALRSTEPRALYHEGDIDPVGPENADFVRLAALSADRVVCAWGLHGALRDQGATAFDWIVAAGAQPLALAITKDGQPRHPLYLRGNLEPRPYAGPPRRIR